MSDPEDKLAKLIDGMPMTWHCIRCGKDFPNRPDREPPHAFEIITDPETGWQTQGGDICRACHQASFHAELKRREGLAP